MQTHIEISNNTLFDDLINHSMETPIVVFKHSHRCIISKWAWRDFENQIQSKDVVYRLNVIEQRALSNQIAFEFNVIHQSPQVLVINQGKCIYHASHEAIDYKMIKPLMTSSE